MTQITQELIRSRATAQSYTRGESHYRNDAIFDTVQRENELEGRCEGSSYPAYHIRVTLDDEGGIVAAACTCPYDWGGDCKHIVALLLTYLHKPNLFEERAPVQDALMERSKEDLIALIHQMMARYPDLQAFVDRPVPGQPERVAQVDTSPFRRELQQATNSYGGWGDRTAESAIYSVSNAAQQFANAGDWRNASAIYRAILDEGLLEENYPFDDEGNYTARGR